MSILNSLERLIGIHQQAPQHQVQQAAPQHQGVPVGQALTPQDIARLPAHVQPLAHIYNQNPQDPRVAHVDPAMFGYQADNAQPSHQMQHLRQLTGSLVQQHGQASNYATPVQGTQNEGYIPVQGSHGVMPMQGGMHNVVGPYDIQQPIGDNQLNFNRGGKIRIR